VSSADWSATSAGSGAYCSLSPAGRGSRRGFLLEDIGGALVAGEQVLAVLGGHERLERVDAREQADEIVLAAEREHSVDQVVTDTGFALLDLEAVGEEVEELSCRNIRSLAKFLKLSLGPRARDNFCARTLKFIFLHWIASCVASLN
jgi:hypothetical protein